MTIQIPASDDESVPLKINVKLSDLGSGKKLQKE